MNFDNDKQQRAIASGIITRSFLHYPLMTYAFSGKTEQQRGQLLYKLYTKCVSAASIYGGLLVTPDKLGALIWLPGKNFTLSLPKEISAGMALIPLQIGIQSTLRLTNHDGESEGWIKKHAAPAMGYVWCVGVLPEAQGRGYSRLLIDQSMRQMHQQGLTECWLKTEDPKNVIIYQKLGFTLMNEMVVKSSGMKSWALRKMILV
jgi:ribosomal protein S18 acetylase RimI-like enzyme